MANNCLVTTLKGVVEKELPKLGVLTIDTYVSESPTNKTKMFFASVESGKTCNLKVIDGYVQTTYNDSTTNTNDIPYWTGSTVYAINQAMKIDIHDKYNIKEFYFGPDYGFDLSIFKYLTNLTAFHALDFNYHITGNINVFCDMLNLTNIVLIYTNITGTVEEFVEGLWNNGKRSD